MKECLSDRLFRIGTTGLLFFLLLIVLYPLYFIVIASVSDITAVNNGEVLFWPAGIQWIGYQKVFGNQNILTGYRNTIVYTALGTALHLSVTLTAGYALSVSFPGKNLLMLFITFTMFFRGGLIPTYLLIQSLHMLDTLWVMIIPGAVNVYNLIIARSFFQSSISPELYNAAEIDGCSRIQFFARIVLPVSGVLVSIMTLFIAVGHWNAYFDALIYLSSRARFPLQLVLREILIQNTIPAGDIQDPETSAVLQNMSETLKYALIIVASLPVMALYPFLQKSFVRGVMIGSLKG